MSFRIALARMMVEKLDSVVMDVATTFLYGEIDEKILLNPGVQPRAGHPEVTGIPQVDYSTSQ